jgi:hypothetical protein
VSTPSAAAVADATCGFDIVTHIPKGPTLVLGAESEIVAAALPSIITVCCEVTRMGAGAVPMVQIA